MTALYFKRLDPRSAWEAAIAIACGGSIIHVEAELPDGRKATSCEPTGVVVRERDCSDSGIWTRIDVPCEPNMAALAWVEEMASHPTGYDFTAAILSGFHHRIVNEGKRFCSQFVLEYIQKCDWTGRSPMVGPISLNPWELFHAVQNKPITEGIRDATEAAAQAADALRQMAMDLDTKIKQVDIGGVNRLIGSLGHDADLAGDVMQRGCDTLAGFNAAILALRGVVK